MTPRTLHGCRILIVEDEYLLADEMRTELAAVGAVIVGPVGTLDGAIALVAAEPALDGALLDVNLRGELVFPVAERLQDRGVPFVFTTGYEASVIPPRFNGVVRCEKPVEIGKVAGAIGRVIGV